MSVKFTVNMKEKYMYDFMLYHNYTHLSGLFGAFVGALGLVVGINGMITEDSSSVMIGFVVAALFLVVTPASIKTRAKTQVASSPMFQKPLEYELGEEGIRVRQDDQEAVTGWGELFKAVSTQKSVIVYVTRMRALIFPKECMGDSYEDVLKMIHTHMPPAKVKIKHIH